MSEINLKPCPFCGGRVGIFEYGKSKMKSQFEAECNFCHIAMRSASFCSEKERQLALKWLVENWNRRAENDD